MQRLRFLNTAVTALVAALFGLVLAAQPARALSLLRDSDIEYALTQLATPVLKAAGLSPSQVKILVIDDPNLNAFVVDRDNIFIHAGLLQRATTADMLQAIIAHEAAHISNGHLARRRLNARSAKTAAGLGMALGIAAAAVTGTGAAAAAGLGAANSAMRLYFAHTRAEETSADASAIRFMINAGLHPQGMVDLLELFRGQDVLSEARQDPYARTHPMTSDRYRTMRAYADAHTKPRTNTAEANYFFARAKGKLSAFLRSPKWTLTRAGEFGYPDVEAMRKAVAYHRQSQTSKAVAEIDRAISLRPNDPFYRDLKGQILFEARQFGPAAAAYAAAAKMAPRDPLILGSYGRALLATGQTRAALDVLERSRQRDGRDARVMRDLGQAYAKLGQTGMASVVTAERYALQGKFKDAAIHAKRASDLLPRGSGPWNRAQDVLSAAKDAAQ